jgi:integrase/recombinase XerD
VVREIGLAAGGPQFATHTTRHLCLTDLAHMGWELHIISVFAGHRSPKSTMAYIHLSSRDLARKLNSGMEHIHSWRVDKLAALSNGSTTRKRGKSGRSCHCGGRRPRWVIGGSVPL